MHPTFKDSTGREWRLALTLGLLTRIREDHGIDLAKLMGKDDLLETLLYGDHQQFANVIWAMVKDQAGTIESEAFFNAIDYTALEAARRGLVVAVANFTRPPKIAAALAANIDRTLDQAGDQAATEMVKEIDRRLASSDFATSSAE